MLGYRQDGRKEKNMAKYEIVLRRKNGELEYTTWFDKSACLGYFSVCKESGLFLEGMVVEIATDNLVAEF